MRLGFWRVLFIYFAVSFVIFTGLIWLSLLSSWLAWFITESNLGVVQVGSTTIDFQQIKSSLQGTRVNFSPLFEGLNVLATVITTPAAIWFYWKATLIVQKTPKTPALENDVEVATRAKPIDYSNDRATLLNGTRLQLMTWSEDYKIGETISKFKALNLPQGSAVYHRPYRVMVKRPNESEFQLGDDTKLLSVLDKNEHWRLLIGEPECPFKCPMLLEVELLTELLEKAQSDVSAFVPVIIPIDFWGSTFDIQEYLSLILFANYKISTVSAKHFVNNNLITVFIYSKYPASSIDESFYNTLHKFWTTSLICCVLQEELMSKSRRDSLATYLSNLPADATISIHVPERIDPLNSTIPTVE